MNRDPSELGGAGTDRDRGAGTPAGDGSGVGGSPYLSGPPLGGVRPEGPYDSVEEHRREIERRRELGSSGVDLQRYSQEAQVKLREWRLQAEDYARKEPGKALAAAALSGFIVGRVLRMLTSGTKRSKRTRELRRIPVRVR